MPDKNPVNAHKNGIVREPTNLSLHPGVKSRGLRAARQLGYDLSSVVEAFLERLHEQHIKRPRGSPCDYLQIEIFSRTPEKKKIKKPPRE